MDLELLLLVAIMRTQKNSFLKKGMYFEAKLCHLFPAHVLLCVSIWSHISTCRHLCQIGWYL